MKPAMPIVVIAAVAAVLWVVVSAREPVTPQAFDNETAMTAAGLLGAGGSEAAPGFARALTPRPFVFPADHGPHEDFQTEWWYLTGNLADSTGREFGFQLTFFRFALMPPGDAPAQSAGEPGSSKWRSTQVYMAHFAIADVAAQRFVSAERFQRDRLGMSGAKAEPFAVWLGDWAVRGAGETGATYPLHLKAGDNGYQLELTLAPTKPVVLNGERGLSQKSTAPGNASYYYSQPRMRAAGSLMVDGVQFEVDGLAWLDREWSTSALAPGQAGWDWFAMQLSDGTDLMLAFIRRLDGSVDPASFGTLIRPDGSSLVLSAAGIEMRVLDRWRSPSTGVVYPAKWDLRVPAHALSLTIEPKLAAQEMTHSIRYWEGAVRVMGHSAAGAVTGSGYAELAGYQAGS